MIPTKTLTTLLLSVCAGLPIAAQVRQIKERSLITDKPVTLTISGNVREASRIATKPSRISLYRRTADTKLLLGNKCAEDVYAQYGMIYVVIPQNFEMRRTRFFFHNFWSNTRLFFRNGWNWKTRMEKKIRRCRRLTGDFVY